MLVHLVGFLDNFMPSLSYIYLSGGGAIVCLRAMRSVFSLALLHFIHAVMHVGENVVREVPTPRIEDATSRAYADALMARVDRATSRWLHHVVALRSQRERQKGSSPL